MAGHWRAVLQRPVRRATAVSARARAVARTLAFARRLAIAGRLGLQLGVALGGLLATGTAGADEAPKLPVMVPFVELTAGPGRGYPALYAVEQGEEVTVLKRRTDWFKLRAPSGREGWVHRDRMLEAFPDTSVGAAGINDLRGSRFEIGMLGGDFGGAASIGLYSALALSPNVSVRLSGAQILGNFSDGWIGTVDVVLQPFAAWRVAPYVALGGGLIQVEPQTTLVEAADRRDQHAHATVGARIYLSRRFTLRAEYDSLVIFTSRNQNEEVKRWQVGVSAFF